MRKRYISSVLFVCTFVCLLNSHSFSQIVPIDGDSVVPSIIGGTNTNISAVPWQVLLEVAGNDACGGTIIAPNWILTACHCLETISGTHYQPNQIKVYAGVTLRSQKSTGQLRNVLQIIRHANYNRTTSDNDIALLRLSSPLSFNTNVQGIRYATANDAATGLTNPGRLGLISGWGWTNNTGTRPDNLQSATLPIISNQEAINRGSNVTANMIALAQNGIGAAPGDSGGPMVVNGNILAGVSSWGHFPKDQNPTIYTRVSRYCDWIADRIAAIEGPTTVCTSNSTFNLRHGPATGATVTWTVTPTNRFTPSSGTGTAATFRTTNNSPGTGTITFTINSGCGTTTVSRSINTNITPLRMPQTTFYGPYATIYGEVDPIPGATSYEWYLNGQFQQVSSYNHEFTVYDCGNYTLGVRARTAACGWTAITSKSFTVTCSGNFAVYPNPADEQLTIEQVSEQDTTTSLQIASTETALQQEAFSIELYNQAQEIVAAATSENGKISLDTSQLPTGTYFLHIYYKDAILQKQIIIE